MLDVIIMTTVAAIIMLSPGFLVGMLTRIVSEMRDCSPEDYNELSTIFKKLVNIEVISWWWDMPGFQSGYRTMFKF